MLGFVVGQGACAERGAARSSVRALAPVFWAAFFVAAAWCDRAAASEPSRWRAQVGVDASADWIRAEPALHLGSSFATPLRVVPPATLPATGAQAMAVVSADIALTVDGRWLVPIFGVSYGWAVGRSSRLETADDGSIVELRPSTSNVVRLLLPGFGTRINDRRWTFSFDLRPVVTLFWMSVSVADGAESSPVGSGAVLATALGARLDLEGCRRVDPTERVCLLLSPAIYEFSFMNGGSLGLRWEIGP